MWTILTYQCRAFSTQPPHPQVYFWKLKSFWTEDCKIRHFSPDCCHLSDAGQERFLSNIRAAVVAALKHSIWQSSHYAIKLVFTYAFRWISATQFSCYSSSIMSRSFCIYFLVIYMDFHFCLHPHGILFLYQLFIFCTVIILLFNLTYLFTSSFTKKLSYYLDDIDIY